MIYKAEAFLKLQQRKYLSLFRVMIKYFLNIYEKYAATYKRDRKFKTA